MITRVTTARIAALSVFCKFLLVSDAQAYIDPGTGSLIFQMALALVVGIGVALRAYWQKIRELFSRRGSASKRAGGS